MRPIERELLDKQNLLRFYSPYWTTSERPLPKCSTEQSPLSSRSDSKALWSQQKLAEWVGQTAQARLLCERAEQGVFVF